MEQLDGIMIATTNLANNLDSAFERRFLYKIKFDSPDSTVRKKLWQTMIPDLSEADSISLANSYELSGGQIENVARKYAINSILYGNQAEPLATLRDYCEGERLNSKKDIRRIGF
jgi:SpoVK/Ycf46/Vps4 family AAA+-type ATPase